MNKNEVAALAEHPDVNALLDVILSQLRKILGGRLIGLYLYGSLVAGDFDYEISDLDLLAATETVINEKEFAALELMHAELVKENPFWDNRIEVAYVSREALKTFKTEKSRIANTSPGEPLHFLEAGCDWLLNWYFAREYGVTLFGAPPELIIESISKWEFIDAVRDQAQERGRNLDEAKHSRPYRAYLIMTVCRALYAVKNGDQVSKRRAASWAKEKFPEYSNLIEDAFVWRARHRDKNINHEATFAETKKFVDYISNKLTD